MARRRGKRRRRVRNLMFVVDAGMTPLETKIGTDAVDCRQRCDDDTRERNT